jgi:hypothetical protein
MALILVCAMLLSFTESVRADPKPLPKEEQARVDKAIDKGVAYLKRMQTKHGNWPTHWRNRYLVGECALPAYALLEAGVPADDPVIQKAAAFIRPKVANTDGTYELSLAVLFFDRLGDPKDEKLIQTCALRLIAGQHYTGGWSYRCPKFKEGQEAALLKALEELNKRMKEGKSTKEALKELELPREMKGLAAFKDLEKIDWRERGSSTGPTTPKQPLSLVGVTDNSNTQFGLLALWVAQRHGIPTGSTFRLLVERFEISQYPNGDWDYGYRNASKEKLDDRGGWPPSMTCVGLLGLAIGRGLKLSTPTDTQQAGKEDFRILAGLAALYSKIGVPTGQWDKPFPMVDYREDIYFLWSVERVGMLFNLPTFGDKEWYRWGAEVLVTNQFDSGEFNAVHWHEEMIKPVRGFYGSILKTAFALLFLKHSHPMKDLTPKLPFTAEELNKGIARLQPSDNRQEQSTTTPSRNTKPER